MPQSEARSEVQSEAQSEVSIERGAIKPLMPRRDGPGLLHLGVQLTLLVASAAWTVKLAASGHSAWVVSVIVCGFCLLAFFPSLHEAAHRTAFATPWLNEAVAWLSALLMLQAPSFFRAFHWEHHRKTQDVLRDPEIASAPQLVDGWPKQLGIYALYACGQLLMLGKASFTVGCAFLPRAVWRRFFPFLDETDDRLARRIVWESRVAVALLGAGVYLALQAIPGFASVLLAWPICHLLLGLYLMPEHTGLGHEGSQLERTRTLESNAWLRWWMWNMPYHAEHHAHPGVPFHAVPVLHDRYVADLPNLSRGYLAFHREALGRALGFQRDQG